MKQLEGKTILVTGASGFIGGHLAKRLARIPGARLLLLSREDREPSSPGATWLKGSLECLTSGYWRSMGILRIDYVFHLGSFMPKGPNELNDIGASIEGNVLGTRSLLDSFPDHPMKVIFASTVDVYAPPGEHEVLGEGSALDPRSMYGASKLFCESLVAAWAAQNGVDCSILRYGHIYGPGEERYQKFIPSSIRRLLAGDAAMIQGDGTTLRDYLYVDDAVEATIRAAQAEGAVGPINIVSGNSVSLKSVAEKLVEVIGGDARIDFQPGRGNGISLRFDGARMATILGQWSRTPLGAGLSAEVDAFRNHVNDR